MPDKHLKDLNERLGKATEQGQEYFGEIILKVANNKIVSIEYSLEIKESKKIVLA